MFNSYLTANTKNNTPQQPFRGAPSSKRSRGRGGRGFFFGFGGGGYRGGSSTYAQRGKSVKTSEFNSTRNTGFSKSPSSYSVSLQKCDTKCSSSEPFEVFYSKLAETVECQVNSSDCKGYQIRFIQSPPIQDSAPNFQMIRASEIDVVDSEIQSMIAKKRSLYPPEGNF